MPSKLGPSVAILCMALACRQPDDHTGAPRVDAPAADIGCIQTAGVRPDTTIRPGDSVKAAAWHAAYDRGREYRCVVSTAMPPYRVMVTHDSMTEVDAISFIPDTARATPAQTIPLDIEFDRPEPYRTDALRIVDLDADGYGDLVVGKSWGGTGNVDYGIWLFDPAKRQFVADSAMPTAPFTDVVPGKPCMWTHWHMSVHDGSSVLYCRRNGQWVADSSESTAWDREKERVIETIQARRGDSMAVVRTRVVPDST